MTIKSVFVFFFIIVGIFAFLNWPYFAVQFSSPSPPNLKLITATENLQEPFLFFPALGIATPIIFPESTEELAIQEALRSGIAHYFGTALPGQIGNVYIVGHSSDFVWAKGDYKTIFARLPKAKLDQEIILHFQGTTYHYRVIETKIVSPNDLSVLGQPTDKKILTLQTSYPLGTALRRFLVIAEQME